jgi:hypothetical protein
MWKWIKIPKAIALLAFVLPWMTVSCSGTRLISATGFGLAFGSYTAEVPMERAATASSNAAINLWLILALAAIIFGLIVSLRAPGKFNALVLAAASAAGIALIWLGTTRYSKDALLAEAGRRGGRATGLNDFANSMDRTAAAMIQVDWHFGFYLALLALIAAGVMAWLTYSGRDAAVAQSVRSAIPGSPAPASPETRLACPSCGQSHPAGTRYCPDDGTALS